MADAVQATFLLQEASATMLIKRTKMNCFNLQMFFKWVLRQLTIENVFSLLVKMEILCIFRNEFCYEKNSYHSSGLHNFLCLPKQN
jgi:hypothetical protein